MPTNRTDSILVVDDETASLRLLTEILDREGYKVRPAESPEMALESALAHPPDLVLLDVRMPGMSGFEVCRRLQQEEHTRGIPIIFVSALHDAQDKVQGFEAGGVDFVSKPFQEPEVLARVNTHLQLRRMQLNLEEMVSERTADLVRAHAEVRENEKRFRSTFEQAAVGIAHVSPEGRFLRINQKFCDIVGYTHDEMLTHTFQDITHPDDLQKNLFHLQKLLRGEVNTFAGEKRYFHKNGGIVWIHLTVSLVCRDTGEPQWFVSVVKDITENKLAEQALERYQQRLKSLASQLAIAEEKERRRIAGDLHDHVGQSLALARMQLSAARRSVSNPVLAGKLDDVSKTLLETLQDTRHLMFELSSPAMNELGLGSAISEWLEALSRKQPYLGAEFLDEGDDGSINILSESVCALLFRNVRELVTNVAKHARTNKVHVRLHIDEDRLQLTVEDDGIGFDPDVVIADGKHEGFGLFSIRERMTDMGGTLKLVSRPGQGCRAILSMPLDERKE